MEQPATINERASKPNFWIWIIDKSSLVSSLWFERIAMVAIVGIIFATLVDVIGAKLFHKPLAAGTEIVYFLQIIAIAAALAFAQIDGRHVRLEFVDSLPRRARNVLYFLSSLLGLALFVILCWKSFAYAQSLRIASEVTAASRMPLFPFAIWIGICCIPMCLVLIRGMVNSIVEVAKR